MGFLRLFFLKQLISKSALNNPKTFSESTTHSSFNFSRLYRNRPTSPNFQNKLYSQICLHVSRSPNTSVVPFLDDWVRTGKNVGGAEIQRIIRTLRCKKLFDRALEISEWMRSKRHGHPFVGDLAVELDLIGKVRGIDAAETYFDEVDNHSEKMYGALLNCYVREGLVDKCLSHFEKMKEKRLANNPLNYNGIMTLYMKTGQAEKIPDLLLEMVVNDVAPDNVSFRLCITSCGLRSDFTTMEKILERIERQPRFSVDLPRFSIDWKTYTAAASYYAKAGFKEKAISFLQKAEDIVYKDAVGYNYLITVYADLGEVSQVLRLWQLQKSKCSRQINIDYIDVMGSLIKLNELQQAETIFQEWESADKLYDFRVPNVLLLGYTQRGQVEKAERMLKGIISRGKTPVPNSWTIIVAGHINKGNMEKAVQCMKKALALAPQNEGWMPKRELISSILSWLGDNEDVEEVEAFLKLLRTIVPMNQEMHHALLKADVRRGRGIDVILQRMKAHNIDVDDKTNRILSSK